MRVYKISGQTPAQKNKKRVTSIGGKPRMYTAKVVQDWQQAAHTELIAQKPAPPEDKVTVEYMFYVKDNRRRDIDNMIASVNDALVKAGALSDDSWQVMRVGSADAELDRENPRAEVWVHG